VDFYDGCLIYDVPQRTVWLCDLDCYRPRPYVLDRDRQHGSTRFMAPEEFRKGAAIDERSTVFTLGRTAFVLLSRGPRGEQARDCGAAATRCTRSPGQRHPRTRRNGTHRRRPAPGVARHQHAPVIRPRQHRCHGARSSAVLPNLPSLDMLPSRHDRIFVGGNIPLLPTVVRGQVARSIAV
jgi:hypothetical protein